MCFFACSHGVRRCRRFGRLVDAVYVCTVCICLHDACKTKKNERNMARLPASEFLIKMFLWKQ